MRVLSVALAVCAVALAGYAAQSPQTGSTITGEIVDELGSPVAAATVRLTRAGVTTRRAVTDASGRFHFDSVGPGKYELEVTKTAFTVTRRTVVVPREDAGRVTVRMTLQPRPSPPPGAAPIGAPHAAPADLFRNTQTAGKFEPSAAASLPSVRPGEGVSTFDVPRPRFNTEAYDHIEDNAFRSTRVDPLSTFSADVDTASYANVRRFLNEGALPPPDAVRIEEMINYFRFDYPRPSGDAPFAVTTEVSVAPWNPKHRLALIGLRARPVESDRALRRNLVFLIDVSGSMMPDNKLPLIRKALRMLVDTLTAQDRIAIVVYAGASGQVLPATPGDHKDRINQAIARLEAGGPTNGAAGIALAYDIARDQFLRGGINRVILATDGDFNVGITNQGDLARLIEQQRSAGIFLSVLGAGTGNLKDSTMEKLADKGNGNYSYLDSVHEARKVLVAEAGGTLVTVAKDVKIQIEFNPARVAAYRLIGYENRVLRHEDFNNDRKDAGEIGAGHTVTALYEIVPPGVPMDLPDVDPLKYQPPSPTEIAAPAHTTFSNELMTVKVRYKQPDGDISKLLTVPVANRTTSMADNIGFAAAVAEFGMLLRQSEHKGSATYRRAAALAQRHRGADEHGYRAELIRLIELAATLSRPTTDGRPERR